MEVADDPISESENEPSNISNNESKKPDRKTLHCFFSSSKSNNEASTSAPEPNYHPPAPSNNLFR